MTSNKFRTPPWNLFLLTVSTSFLSRFAFGFHYAVPGLIPELMEGYLSDSMKSSIGNHSYSYEQHLHIAAGRVTLVMSFFNASMSITILFGCLVAASLADRFGRRPTLFLINSVLTMVGGISFLIATWVDAWHLLIIGRMLIGFSAGIAITVVPVYLIECSPLQHRCFICSLQAPVTYVSSCVDQILSMPQLLGTEDRWHYLLAIPAIPALIQLTMFCLVPESPQFELIQRRNGQRALSMIRQYFGHSYTNSVNVESIFTGYEMQRSQDQIKVDIWKTITTVELRSTLLVVTVFAFIRSASGESVINTYTLELLTSLGIPEKNVDAVAIAMQVSMVVASFLGIPLMSTVGRRPLVIYACAYLAFSWTMIAVLQIGEAGWFAWASLGFLLSNVIIYPLAVSSITLCFASEMCVQSVRASISAISLGSGVIPQFFTIFCYPIFAKWSLTTSILTLFSFQLLVISIFLYFRMPETKDVTMTEIVKDVQARYFNRKKSHEEFFSENKLTNTETKEQYETIGLTRNTYGSIQ